MSTDECAEEDEFVQRLRTWALQLPKLTPIAEYGPLRLSIPADVSAQIARVAVCGESPRLGTWVPVIAPSMVCCEYGRWVLANDIRDVEVGSPFLFVIIRASGGACWEIGENMRKWPPEGQILECTWAVLAAEEPKCIPRSIPGWTEAGPSEVPSRSSREKTTRRLPRPDTLREPEDGLEIIGHWGTADTLGNVAEALVGPRTICNMFNMSFALVQKLAARIAEYGFDAVQLSPAQRSKEGKEWWSRYQPMDYGEIHGLGNEKDLADAIAACKDAGLQVIGDCAFEHMLPVANAQEWREAQSDPELLEQLKDRLTKTFGPKLSREDFHFPWFELIGKEWDGDMRLEGWGCGEWSKLSPTPAVIQEHTGYIEKLVECGIDGLRFDSAKHMRSDVVGQYLSIARDKCPPDSFLYLGMLTVQHDVQMEYMFAHDGRVGEVAPKLPCPSTDFILGAWLHRFLEYREGKYVWPEEPPVQEREGGIEGRRGAAASGGDEPTFTVPLLARNSVRFARSHETVHAGQVFYGLGGWSREGASIGSAMLCAVHDGIVLLLESDMSGDMGGAPIVRDAVQYRKDIWTLLQDNGGVTNAWTDFRIRRIKSGSPPWIIIIAVRLLPREETSKVLGFMVMNPILFDKSEPVTIDRSDAVRSSTSCTFESINKKDADMITVYPDGSFSEPCQESLLLPLHSPRSEGPLAEQ